MASNHHNDEVFKEKRRPKGEIKFNVTLNEEQKEAKAIILKNTVTVLKGKAGSGKSLLAAQVALDLLFKREIENIIITRPTITAGESIGFLPGSIADKLQPFTAPVYDNMHRLYNKEKIEKFIEEGRIEVIPIGFLRGRNFTNSLVVVDEGQNITHNNMELLLGRICLGSRMIICGDSAQIDLPRKTDSGFDFLCKNFTDVPGFAIVSLKTNHRHPIVEDILRIYSDYRS
jgi:phosphate starvation-inducible PhoH-like protein